jgi:hypothetical protein
MTKPTRNISLESITTHLIHTCQNEQCNQEFDYTEIKNHRCQQTNCPVYDCYWTGPYTALESHLTNQPHTSVHLFVENLMINNEFILSIPFAQLKTSDDKWKNSLCLVKLPNDLIILTFEPRNGRLRFNAWNYEKNDFNYDLYYKLKTNNCQDQFIFKIPVNYRTPIEDRNLLKETPSIFYLQYSDFVSDSSILKILVYFRPSIDLLLDDFVLPENLNINEYIV